MMRRVAATEVLSNSAAARHIKLMSYVMVDVEADGPAPGLYSLVSIGAVLVTPALDLSCTPK